MFALQMALLGFLPQFLSFYLSSNKTSVSRVTSSHWERESAWRGVPERIGALIIFSELKKSLVMSGFKPRPPVRLASASLPFALCPSGSQFETFILHYFPKTAFFWVQSSEPPKSQLTWETDLRDQFLVGFEPTSSSFWGVCSNPVMCSKLAKQSVFAWRVKFTQKATLKFKLFFVAWGA